MTDAIRQEINHPQIAFGRHIPGILVILLFFTFSIFAQINISQPDENTIIVDTANTEVFALGKTVIVKNDAKGVLAIGGDIIIEGRVEGDVATIGGSVIQKENGFIGGDIIILGGKYQPENQNPLRNPDKETIMYAGYEEELRGMAKNPSQILSTEFSVSFLIQRILSLLFWFALALGLTTITPNSVSRAVARFRLSTLSVFGIGSLAFGLVILSVTVSFGFLPSFISAIVGLMAFVLVMLAYVFGRVALQVSVGNWILRKISSDKKPSETISIFVGVLFWTLLLSIPYIWTLAVFVLFTASLGLVLTASSKIGWEK